jgi:hypothetical protein
MRKLILAAVLVGLAAPAVPVHAQQGPTPEDIAEKRDKETLDRQYKNALKAMQGDSTQAAAKTDPWATMRAPTPASAPSAKR